MKHVLALLVFLLLLSGVIRLGGWQDTGTKPAGGHDSSALNLSTTIHSPPEMIEWGIYQIHWGRRFPGDLLKSIDWLGASPDYIMFYRDLGCLRRYPADTFATIRSYGAVPIISQELWSWGDRDTQFLDMINSGEFDGLFRRWASEAADDGQRLLYRFGFEFNGDWFSWSGRPAVFAECWRRIHGIFQEAGATNVEWVWCPNVSSHPSTPENDMHHYWPGSEYVDWVGLDGYNWGDDHDEWHRWSPFDEIFKSPLDEFAHRYPEKPIIIGEFASVPGEGQRQADWIRDAFESIQRYPKVKAVVWFNYDKRREGEHNWRLDSSPESLQAFRETFAQERLPIESSP
jgi:hypothetical protein